VFLYDASEYRDRQGFVHMGPGRILCLGIVAQAIRRFVQGDVQIEPARLTTTTEELIDLGIVYKSSEFNVVVDMLLERMGDRRVL